MANSPYPKKIQEAIELLVEEGYFKNKKEIINVALFQYMKDNELFKAVAGIKLRKIEDEKWNGG